MKTAEEFYNLKYPKHTRLLKKWVIELMEEYAHQSQPTDEEIIAFFTKEHYHYQKGRYTKVDKDRIYGAKMMRDNKIPHKS